MEVVAACRVSPIYIYVYRAGQGASTEILAHLFRRLSDKESEVVVADEKRLVDLVKGPSFVEDPEAGVFNSGGRCGV